MWGRKEKEERKKTYNDMTLMRKITIDYRCGALEEEKKESAKPFQHT
jgi:hypothetical protein